MVSLSSYQTQSSFSQIADREQNLRSVLENIQDGILVTDLEGRVESQNRSAAAIFGFDSESTDDTGLAELLLPAHWADLAPRIRDADSDIWGSRNEVTGRRCDGDVFPMELTLTRIRQGEREILIVVVIMAIVAAIAIPRLSRGSGGAADAAPASLALPGLALLLVAAALLLSLWTSA